MTGILIDYDALTRRAAEFGFRRASFDDLQSGLALAEHLTEQTMATPESICWIDGLTGMAGWVTGDPVDGVFITVPLSAEGVAAVRGGSFVPAWPALSHLACEGAPCSGVYIGVYAGVTKEARRAVMMAAGVTRVEFFAPVPCFARGATEAGKRSMTSLGFQPIEGGLPDLWGQEPLPVAQEKAA
ncbi:hypothetical protein [Hyphomonas sp.]|uniref:hypothetical protein n=1 Tax=Hyphomonas sp. TaxID=87 RepID=UPI003919A44B